MKNCANVLLGKKTWVGYFFCLDGLPQIKESILSANGIPRSVKQTLPHENLEMLDYWYARDYEPLQDIGTILKNYRYLGA